MDKSSHTPPWPVLTDESPMPFGQYKGEKMCNVDAEYLLYCYDMPWLKKWPEVEHYISENFDALLKEQTEQRKAK